MVDYIAVSNEKIVDIPGDVQQLWTDYEAYKKLRDQYCKLRWGGYRLAVKAARKAEKCRETFWVRIYEVYPETKTKELNYNWGEGTITIKDAE